MKTSIRHYKGNTIKLIVDDKRRSTIFNVNGVIFKSFWSVKKFIKNSSKIIHK